ncbi:EAL and HDOD domain-containing protein [Solicola sp. PLA-1-18]|uniref:EAL and HDOD domain-containing protein n=1 Tax=Solicola sp. PLA-1-18 TaxID=3380532 RepID=UPI003B826E76
MRRTGSPTPLVSSEVVVGRQPIVDATGAVTGYELLYRLAGPEAVRPGGDQMTTHVVLSALSLGLDLLAGDLLVFCNVGRGVVEGHLAMPLPPRSTVAELPTPHRVTPVEVAGCRRLREQGYQVSLDGFVWSDGVEDLLALADFAKIDLLDTPEDELGALVRRCHEHGVRAVATKVESDQALDLARAHGFDLFQGYGVERPGVVGSDGAGPSDAGRVQLATMLLTTELDSAELEWVVGHDAVLAHDLVRLAGVDPTGGLARSVASPQAAIRMLGTVRSRQWACLLILERCSGGALDGLLTAVQRARMCEELARSRGLPRAHLAFAAAVLSALDALAGLDPAEVSAVVDLDRTVGDAVLLDPWAPLVRLAREVGDHQRRVQVAVSPLVALTDELDLASSAAYAWSTAHLSALGPRRPHGRS